MNADVEPGDWAYLDPWWSAYTQARSIAHRPGSARVLDTERKDSCWEDLDSWWQAYTKSPAFAQSPISTQERADSWAVLDDWWDIYTKEGHEKAAKLATLLDRSNEGWSQSDCSFDTDPLAADLTLDRFSRGPLQPSNEVGWSRWLTRVLAPSPTLVSELFDIEVNEYPDEVVREDELLKPDGAYRRPDILVCYEDRGVSIEVKLGDENYQKTAETASLVERHYNGREWNHSLLLPKRQLSNLQFGVDAPVEENSDGTLNVEWSDPGPIPVIFWCEVTAAIRSVLRRGDAVDDHWAANAYLFCAVAEQQIMGFQPQKIVKEMSDPSTIVDSARPIQLATALDEQLTYIRTVLDA